MVRRVAVFVNGRSGAALQEAELGRALDAAGVDASAHYIPGDVPVARWIAGIAPDYDVLVAAGGDGTVSAVAAAAVALGKDLGVIPAGTLNHYARDAGIPSELNAAISILAAGHTRRLDVGMVNESMFINNASIGAYPHMVRERDRTRRKGWPRPLAMARAMIRTWLDLRPMTLHLRVDDVEVIRRSPFLFVGNSAYEVEGTNVGRRTILTDGTLSLYVAPDSGRLDALTLPWHMLRGTLKEHDKFETWQAASISVHLAPRGPRRAHFPRWGGRRRIAVALDGELHTMNMPLSFSIQRGALNAIVPAVPQGER